MSSSKEYLQYLKNDIPSGIVVFLVAVPLCLGIALASGVPLFSGIISGVIGGLIVSVLSGSPLGVSGPAAGLVVIVLNAQETLGTFEAFLMAVVIAGIIQIVMGFAKAGIVAYYFPSAVIKGMLAGIGIIIIIKQIPHAFGYDRDYQGDLSFFQPDGHNTFSELYYMLDFLSPGPIIITLISVGLMILWERPFMKRIPVFQILQGPLVAVVVGVLLQLAFRDISWLALKKEQLVNIPVINTMGEFLNQFVTPDFSRAFDPSVWIVGATLAIVASLETLLCVEATDKLDPYKRVTPTNRELHAQGVGNVIAGLIGGLPLTQVIVRSSTNIQSGGRTKAAAFVHGIFLMGSVLLFPGFLNMIPLASLAAILFIVGYKLAQPKVIKNIYDLGMKQFIPFAVTVVAIIFTDLLIGITVGLVFAIFNILYQNYKSPYFFQKQEHEPGKPIRFQLAEDVTFLNKASILQTLNHLPDDSKVIIDGSKTAYMDHDIIETITDFEQNAKHRNIDLELIGIQTKSGENQHKRFSSIIIDGNNEPEKKD